MTGAGDITGPGGHEPPGPNGADARIHPSAQLLLPGREAAGVEIYSVRLSEDGAASVRVSTRRGTPHGGRVVGVEIGSPRRFRGFLDGVAGTALDDTAADLYFLTRTRAQLSAVLRLLRRRGIGRARVHGIDPDYYHAVVPLHGAGHRDVERYVLGLKRRTGRAATLKALLKRVLITLGLSRRLYDGFLVVIDRHGPSEADRLDLQVDP